MRCILLIPVLLGVALAQSPPPSPPPPPCPAGAAQKQGAMGSMMMGGQMGMGGMMMGGQMSPQQMKQMRGAMACLQKLTREMKANLPKLQSANPAVRRQFQLITEAFNQLSAMMQMHGSMAKRPPPPARPK